MRRPLAYAEPDYLDGTLGIFLQKNYRKAEFGSDNSFLSCSLQTIFTPISARTVTN